MAIPVIVEDYVVDELLTLLKARGEIARALSLGENLLGGNLATLYRVFGEDLFETWRIFRTFQDKQWSFTDCSRKAVMERLNVTMAFAFDHHFHQFGTVTVVP